VNPSTPYPSFFFGDLPVSARHRFMESADINAAFRELFAALRTSVRRGMTNRGQIYAIEMDACVPGDVVATTWIPPASRGLPGSEALADPARRRALVDRLLAEPRTESLFAYVCERGGDGVPAHVYLEIVAATGTYAAEYPVTPSRGWHQRELSEAQHRRLAPVAAG
jgi:hypothetical protein